MSSKGIIIGVLLLGGVVVSIFLWRSTSEGAGGDQSVMSHMEKFVCSKCGGSFEMSVEQVTRERRANEGHLKCPLCGELDPEKQDVKIKISGMGGEGEEETKGFDSDEGGDEEEEAVEEAKPKLSPPGLQRKKG